jgi:putative tryptophan/tyrosine transport system substrate-binding protein
MAGPALHGYASASCKPPRDRGALARSDEDAPSFPLVGKSGDRTMAADALGVQLYVLEVDSPAAFEGAFAAMSLEGAGALLTLSCPFCFSARARLVALAAQHRLPVMFRFPAYVEAGGLMAYGPNIADIWRRAASYVDRLLKGAKPADLPVEQPTTFELVINLKAAQALGLMIPPALLFQADKVIQ